jgi:hypothetical protein
MSSTTTNNNNSNNLGGGTFTSQGGNKFKNLAGQDDYHYSTYFYDDYYYHRNPSTPDDATIKTGFKTKTKDVGFVGYVATTVDPGTWMLVLTLVVCFLSLAVVPCLNIWGRQYEEWRKNGKVNDEDILQQQNQAGQEDPQSKKSFFEKFGRGGGAKLNSSPPHDLALTPTRSREVESSSSGNDSDEDDEKVCLTPPRKNVKGIYAEQLQVQPKHKEKTGKSYPPVTKVGRANVASSSIAASAEQRISIKGRMAAAVDKVWSQSLELKCLSLMSPSQNTCVLISIPFVINSELFFW